MDTRAPRGTGWLSFSAIVLIIGGVFAIIDGLVAVSRATFFAENAVYVFSGLNTWGWIIFGLGCAGVVSGLALFTGSEWARWLGLTVAAVSALGQLLFAQAYPVWSLMIMAIDFLVIYGLAVHAGREEMAYMSGEFGASEQARMKEVREQPTDQARRVA